MRSSLALVTTLCLLGGCQPVEQTVQEAAASKTRPPNIVVIFSDELAPEFLGSYGGSFPTPNLDRLAGQGMRFTRAYAAGPMCTPSRFGLLTGSYPGRSIDPQFLASYPTSGPYSVAWDTYLTPETTTLPRLLSRAGYVTGMAGKWHLSRHDVELPELSEDADISDPGVQARLAERQARVRELIGEAAGFDDVLSAMLDNFDGFPVKALAEHNFPWITKGAVEFIEERAQSQRPFFLYVATTAVHGPFHPNEFKRDARDTLEGRVEAAAHYALDNEKALEALESVAPHLRHRHAGMTSLDHHVGVLLDKLDELGITENTIVVFMADHNTEPAKATCFEKGSVVPMLVRWPGTVAAGSVTDALAQGVDILPTLLEAAGVAPPAGLQDGTSLLPVLRDPAARVRDHVYLEAGYARAVTDGKHKYIALRFPEPVIAEMKNGEREHAPYQIDVPRQAHHQIAIEHYPAYYDPDQLYDLEQDPYEQVNVADQPDKQQALAELRGKLEARLSTFSHPYDLSDIEFMYSDEYRALADKTRAIGTDWIVWLARDHGGIVWPPAGER